MPAIPFVSSSATSGSVRNVNDINAWDLWTKGLVAAANIDMHAVSSGGISTILFNLATKRGYNALRLFVGDAWGNALTNDVVSVADASAGWSDTAISRQGAAGGDTLADLAANIDTILSVCQKTGMGLILTVGNLQQNSNSDSNSLWEQPSLQAKLVQFWTKTATRWPAGTAGLLGFELLNEPTPGFVNGESMFYSAMRAPGSTHNWKGLAEQCIAAIRVTQPNLPIVIDTIDGGSALGFDFFRVKTAADSNWGINNPAVMQQDHFSLDYDSTLTTNLVADTRLNAADLNEPRLVYSFHMYSPMSFTHQGIYEWEYQSLGTPYPGTAEEGWAWHDGNVFIWRDEFRFNYESKNDLSGLNYAVRRARAFKRDFMVPIFVGEFSAVDLNFLNEPNGLAYTPATHDRRRISAITVNGSTTTATLLQPARVDAKIVTGDDGSGNPTWANTRSAKITIKRSLDHSVLVNNASVTFVHGQSTFSFATPSGLTSQTDNTYYTIVLDAPLLSLNAGYRLAYARDVLLLCHDHGFSWAWHFEYGTTGIDYHWRPSADIAHLLARSTARNFKR